jgi:hypothetical protein
MIVDDELSIRLIMLSLEHTKRNAEISETEEALQYYQDKYLEMLEDMIKHYENAFVE